MKKLILFVFIFGIITHTKAQVKIGNQPPEISLPNKMDSIVNLSTYKGKVVLLDFWASWCMPCRAKNPSLVALHKRYASKGLQIISVSIDNKKTAWLKAIKQDKIPYITVNDNGGWEAKTITAYNINEIPATFLIDKMGKVIAINLDGRRLENKIKNALK